MRANSATTQMLLSPRLEGECGGRWPRIARVFWCNDRTPGLWRRSRETSFNTKVDWVPCSNPQPAKGSDLPPGATLPMTLPVAFKTDPFSPNSTQCCETKIPLQMNYLQQFTGVLGRTRNPAVLATLGVRFPPSAPMSTVYADSIPAVRILSFR
jgi:hypothetical protein